MSSQDLITNRDIIIVGQQPWDVEIGSNCKDIAIEFSKYNRVPVSYTHLTLPTNREV